MPTMVGRAAAARWRQPAVHEAKHKRIVAIGVARSASTQIVKAVVGEMRPFRA